MAKRKSAFTKTLDDCTHGDIMDLAEAARELLYSYMFQMWVRIRNETEKEPDETRIVRNARAAFMQCGIPITSYEEFVVKLEKRLLKEKETSGS